MQPKSDLSAILQFTPDDLNDNREGKLSPGQIERLQAFVRASRAKYLRQLAIVVAVCVLLAVGLADVTSLGLSLLGMVIVASVAVLAYVIFRSQRSLSAGSVQTVRGKVSSYSTHRNKSQPAHYFVKVGTVNFEVAHEVFQAFHKGSTVTVYYVNLFAQTIVAAEESA